MAASKLHVLFLAFFTPSHMIPLVNAARVFARHGVRATILTTKHNASMVQNSVDCDDLEFHNLEFPAAELGLPEGVESVAAATSLEMMGKVYMSLPLLKKPMEEAIESISPHCIFSDMYFPWTVDLARKMNIPRIMFYVNSLASHCVPENLKKYEPHKTVDSESESFMVPGLPDEIEMKRSQVEDYMKEENQDYSGVMKDIKETERHSFAVVFDNVYELEHEYVDYYEKVIGTRIRTIGPLFHFANKVGPTSRVDWLDSQAPHSVLYVSFGTMARFSQAQVGEIAKGLEGSKQPFIWVVRNSDRLPEGFEERIEKSNRGLIFKGWGPQLSILQHEATGGFLTHCGWNSTLEAAAAGVPLITWPLFAEQFYNQIAITRILKTGISLGSDVWHLRPILEGVLAPSSDIEKAVNRLFCDSEESRQIRKRSGEIAQVVKNSVEIGGSSYQNVLGLIQDLKSCAFPANN